MSKMRADRGAHFTMQLVAAAFDLAASRDRSLID